MYSKRLPFNGREFERAIGRAVVENFKKINYDLMVERLADTNAEIWADAISGHCALYEALFERKETVVNA